MNHGIHITIRMSDISYTIVPTQSLFTVKDHCSIHVRLFWIDKDGKLVTALGHNEKYDNGTSFGGFGESGETLLETLLREYMEESLGSLTTDQKLKEYLLDDCTIVRRTSIKGDHYTVFCTIKDTMFDIDVTRSIFKQERAKPDLNEGQKENDDIVFVSLDEISNAFGENLSADVNVKTTEGQTIKIRGINMPAYKWFVDTLKKE